MKIKHELRDRALRYAVDNYSDSKSTKEIVKIAEEYFEFLSGKKEEE